MTLPIMLWLNRAIEPYWPNKLAEPGIRSIALGTPDVTPVPERKTSGYSILSGGRLPHPTAPLRASWRGLACIMRKGSCKFFIAPRFDLNR